MAEISPDTVTVTLRTGVVPDAVLMTNLSYRGDFRALGYMWKAGLQYRQSDAYVTFLLSLDPVSSSRLSPAERQVLEAKEFVATVTFSSPRIGGPSVCGKVSFRGGSGGCIIPDALSVQLYSRLAVSAADPILMDHAEHSIIADIKLECLRSSPAATTPATPRRQGIRELFSSGKFTDVTLSVQNVEFRAHMSLLASQSDIFDAMFGNGFKEREDRVVVIEDMAPETMNLLLSHIHQHDLPKNLTVGDIVSLMRAADRYNVRGLLDNCDLLLRQIQSSAITSDGYQSLLEAFILGYRLQNHSLMEVVVSLIKREIGDITATKTFSRFLTGSTEEAAELFKMIAKAKDVGSHFRIQ